MSMPLSLFPARVPIGSYFDPKTKQNYPVNASAEFLRALSALMVRVGGPSSPSITELPTDANARIAGETFRQREQAPFFGDAGEVMKQRAFEQRSPAIPANTSEVNLLNAVLAFRPQATTPNNDADASRILAGQIFGA